MYFADYEEAYDWAEREILYALKHAEDYELIDIQIARDGSPEVWDMDSFDECFSGESPSEIVKSIAPGFDFSDQWFYFNDDNKCQSFSSLSEVPDLKFDLDDIAHDIVRYGDSYGNEEIQEVLDELNSGS